MENDLVKYNDNLFRSEEIIEDIKPSIFYLVGVFCNRGNIRERVLIIETYKEFFAKIVKNKLEKISVNIKEKRRCNKNKIFYVIFGTLHEKYWKIFQDILKKIKSGLPDFQWDDNLRRAFLRGFFDAKGFLNIVSYYDKNERRKKKKIRIRASSKSFDLLNLIHSILNKEGVKSRVYCIANKKKDNKLYVIEIQGRSAIYDFKKKIGSERLDFIEKIESALRY